MAKDDDATVERRPMAKEKNSEAGPFSDDEVDHEESKNIMLFLG
jgi:hypothetical protein